MKLTKTTFNHRVVYRSGDVRGLQDQSCNDTTYNLTKTRADRHAHTSAHTQEHTDEHTCTHTEVHTDAHSLLLLSLGELLA